MFTGFFLFFAFSHTLHNTFTSHRSTLIICYLLCLFPPCPFCIRLSFSTSLFLATCLHRVQVYGRDFAELLSELNLDVTQDDVGPANGDDAEVDEHVHVQQQ